MPAGRRRRALAGVAATIATLFALPDPNGEQRGGLEILYDTAEYVKLAALAVQNGIAGFGDASIGAAPVRVPAPILTAPGHAPVDAPVYLDPTPQAVLAHAEALVARAREAGADLGSYYVGKFSLYGLHTHDVGEWATESLERLRAHRHRAAKNMLTFIIACYADEGAALRAEQTVAERLGANTGLDTTNTLPYTTGCTSFGKGTGFALYLQLQ